MIPDRVTVLVDARNVLRSQWPNIPEAELVERCAAWAAQQRAHAVLVFDGEAPGSVVGEREAGPLLLVGTGRESADAWLERAAEECRRRGERHWLVTSDRALRAVAGAGAERVIGGGSLARELRALGTV